MKNLLIILMFIPILTAAQPNYNSSVNLVNKSIVYKRQRQVAIAQLALFVVTDYFLYTKNHHAFTICGYAFVGVSIGTAFYIKAPQHTNKNRIYRHVKRRHRKYM